MATIRLTHATTAKSYTNLTDENGKAVPKLDPFGAPVLDEKGNSVYEQTISRKFLCLVPQDTEGLLVPNFDNSVSRNNRSTCVWLSGRDQDGNELADIFESVVKGLAKTGQALFVTGKLYDFVMDEPYTSEATGQTWQTLTIQLDSSTPLVPSVEDIPSNRSFVADTSALKAALRRK